MFNKLTVCLDMYGCPNRCRHCWIGITPNPNMSENDLIFTAEKFKPFGKKFEIFDWYREPDFHSDYKKIWDLTEKLSDCKTPHFELLSYWRAVRDEKYIPWLKSKGVSACQLTLFGNEKTTDKYVGRKGAYSEILKTVDLLIENKISPRIQMFINKDNIDELPYVEELISKNRYKNRCENFGGKFVFFIHQGSCDGENEKLYDIRITKSDLNKIPPKILNETKAYMNCNSVEEIFGKPESELYIDLVSDNSTSDLSSDKPVFYVNKNFDVYPNFTTPAPFWKIGNLKNDDVDTIIFNFANNKTLAQSVSMNTPISQIVSQEGNPYSERLFDKNDYIMYLLNRYCRKLYKSKQEINLI